MKLTPPSPSYNSAQEAQRNRVLEQADQQNHKKNQDMRLGYNGDRLIMLGDDGNEYKIYINGSGVLSISAV